jgi:hypothetical protein
MAKKAKNTEEQPYGNSTGAWHQVVSKSDPCDSRGKIPKANQQVDQNTKPVGAKLCERDSTAKSAEEESMLCEELQEGFQEDD